MMKLARINKTYGSQRVLHDFSYTFANSGFYLIFGRSGSGKTTLINIISGIIDYDSGSFVFGDHEIKGKQDQTLIRDNLAYLSQDVYFVDYLTIRENYELSHVDVETYTKRTKQFGLYDCLDRYPHEVSTGQKQRLAIVQALAAHKKVLVLDEPTAALDKENKKLVFELLKQVSEDILVICVSHDGQAKEYCDELIDLSKTKKEELQNFDCEECKLQKKEYVSTNLYPYVKKMKTYKRKKSFSNSSLVIVFTLVILLAMNIYDPESKLIQSMGEDYHLNYIYVNVPVENRDTLIETMKAENPAIVDIVYPYRMGADYGAPPDRNVVMVQEEAYIESLGYETLPLGSSFYYRDYLLAGAYFENSNEVVLAYNKALEYSNDPSRIVNKEIMIETPIGKETFLVTGVFKEFGDKEMPYFQNGFSVDKLNYVVFFNDAYSNTYMSDAKLSLQEKDHFQKGTYILYFNDFGEMLKFSEANTSCQMGDQSCIDVVSISSHLHGVIEEFIKTSVILIPCLVLALFMCILFYCQMKIKQLYQSKHIMCVYQYYGYTQKDVMKAYKRYYRNEVIRTVFISMFSSLIIAFICNEFMTFLIYPLFSISPLVIVLCGFLFFVVCNTWMVLLINRMKKADWYELMKERRDLL